MFVMTLLAGAFEALFPTEAIGVVVVMVGLSLVPIGASNLMGLSRTDTF